MEPIAAAAPVSINSILLCLVLFFCLPWGGDATAVVVTRDIAVGESGKEIADRVARLPDYTMDGNVRTGRC